MPEVTNHDRAEWFRLTLDYFLEITGSDDHVEAASDLLCDFLHWCRMEKEDVGALVATAVSAFEEEVILDDEDQD